MGINLSYRFGCQLPQTMSRSGRRRAHECFKLRAIARWRCVAGAASTYRQTVLQGLQQVADALRVLEEDAELLAAGDHAQRRGSCGARGAGSLRGGRIKRAITARHGAAGAADDVGLL